MESLNNVCTCYKCLAKIDWEEASEDRGNIWDCESCGVNFCTVCFLECAKSGGKLPGDAEYDVVRCPNCFNRFLEMMESIRAIEPHHTSYDQLGNFAELNIEGKFNFAEFYPTDFNGMDELHNIMYQFEFSTEVTSEKDGDYFNKMNLIVHQINHGITHYIQNDFDWTMRNMTELDGQVYGKNFLIAQFELALEMFTVAVNEVAWEKRQSK